MSCRTFLLLLAAAVISVPLFGAPALAAPAPCSVSAILDDPELEAYPTSTAAGSASTGGTLTIVKPASVRAVITITASVSTGWPITVTPATFVVTQQSTAKFEVEVVVPPGTLTTEVGEGTLIFQMIAGGIQCPGTVVNGPYVYPQPYLDEVTLRVSPPVITIPEPSRTAALRLEIGAKTNAPAQVEIDLDLPPGASHNAPAGFTLTPAANATANTSVDVRMTGTGLAPGTYSVSVRARGDPQSEHPQEASVNLTVVVAEPAPLVTEPPVVVGIAAAVGVAGYAWWRHSRRHL